MFILYSDFSYYIVQTKDIRHPYTHTQQNESQNKILLLYYLQQCLIRVHNTLL